MFRCWFTSMYSDKKMNPFFYILLETYFVHFSRLFFGDQPKMVVFSTFFFIVQCTWNSLILSCSRHLKSLCSVWRSLYEHCRQFRIGSVERRKLWSRLSYLSWSSFLEYRISNSPPPPHPKKPASNRSNYLTVGESNISVSDRIFYAELI